MTVRLPEQYKERIKWQLGNEYDRYLECFQETFHGGLRVNTLKISPQDFLQVSPFSLERVPWIENGFYYPEGEQPAKHPFYFAGLYYLQEPSAMTPANLLPVCPGDRVLDLCAAPGGKSTELAAKLRGKGVLISNDISNSRAKALLKNIELFGIRNVVVVSESPAKLSGYFERYFDKILVDAPCSGEGMFRKSPVIIKNWEQYGTDYYYDLQKQILPEAVRMLKPGGYLLYSTCTFSPQEDEGTAQYVLDRFPEMELVPAKPFYNDPKIHPKEHDWTPDYSGMECGRPDWIKDGSPELDQTLRLWPHKLKGEGHFIALFRKKTEEVFSCSSQEILKEKPIKLSAEAEEFLQLLHFDLPKERLYAREDKLYLLPEGLPELSGLRILRSGLLLGERKKNRFEPSQALANALKKTDYDNCYNMDIEDPDVIRYLKCESIEPKQPLLEGFVLVCAGGYPLGWAKYKNGNLKNKYLSGWRMM